MIKRSTSNNKHTWAKKRTTTFGKVDGRRRSNCDPADQKNSISTSSGGGSDNTLSSQDSRAAQELVETEIPYKGE